MYVYSTCLLTYGSNIRSGYIGTFNKLRKVQLGRRCAYRIYRYKLYS